MTAPRTFNGGVLSEVEGGLLLQSCFRVNGAPAFAPDADHTTMSVDVLEAWAASGCPLEVAPLPDGLDRDVVLTSLPNLVEAASSTVRLHLLDHAVAVVDGEAPEPQGWPTDGTIDLDPEMHAGLEHAWELERSLTNVSQGAYVSDRTHRLGMGARLGLAAQAGPTWPPRGADVDGHLLSGGAHLQPSGTVYSWTRLIAAGAPSEFALRAPLLGGLTSMVIDLDDGPRGVFLHADGHDANVEIGDRVRLVVRRLYAQDGVLRYGRKALN